MRVRIDLDICCGHGRCYALCPEVFLEDDAGYPVVENPEVPEGFEAKVRSAARNCPELAIAVED